MFTVKLRQGPSPCENDPDAFVMASFSCPSYSVMRTKLKDKPDVLCLDVMPGASALYGEAEETTRNIPIGKDEVYTHAYVENMAGKTIDRIGG